MPKRSASLPGREILVEREKHFSDRAELRNEAQGERDAYEGFAAAINSAKDVLVWQHEMNDEVVRRPRRFRYREFSRRSELALGRRPLRLELRRPAGEPYQA
jgi:hypothetical protein